MRRASVAISLVAAITLLVCAPAAYAAEDSIDQAAAPEQVAAAPELVAEEESEASDELAQEEEHAESSVVEEDAAGEPEPSEQPHEAVEAAAEDAIEPETAGAADEAAENEATEAEAAEPEPDEPELFSAPARSGWVNEDGAAYYYSPQSGEKLTGWQRIDGKNRYLDPSKAGALLKGPAIVEIEGKLFCISARGEALSGVRSVDGGKSYYLFAASDVPGENFALTGWQKLDGKRYYAYPATKKLATGETSIGGATYLFSAKGAMLTGWQRVGSANKLYYLSTGALVKGPVIKRVGSELFCINARGEALSGVRSVDGGKSYYLFAASDVPGENFALTGWQKLDGKRYYADPATKKLATGTHTIDGFTCKFNSKGVLISTIAPDFKTGWNKVGGDWYWSDDGVSAKTGWLNTGGKCYWLEPSNGGKMATGLFTASDGKTYAADSSGACPASSWVEVDGARYLTNKNRVVRTGWATVGDKRYYLVPAEQGRPCVGLKKISGKEYFFGNDGTLMTSAWVILPDGSARYANADGVLGGTSSRGGVFRNPDGSFMKGWLDDNGATFFIDGKTGTPCKGYKTISGKKYLFDSTSGVQLFGWQMADGKAVFFDPYSEPRAGAQGTTEDYLISVCKAELDNTDGSKYWMDSYGWDGGGYDWCAVFVNDMLKVSGIKCPYYNPKGAYASYAFDRYDESMFDGRLVEIADLKRGDVIAFDWLEYDGPNGELQRNGRGDHVGFIIDRIDETRFLTIEGNTLNSEGVRAVQIKERSVDDMICGLRPYFDKYVPTVK